MQQRHLNRKLYFDEQEYTTKKYVIPYINCVSTINSNMHVMEVGCGEGGNPKPFLDMGCKVTGIDISTYKIELAKDFFSSHPHQKNLTLLNKNIYDTTVEEIGKFDVIFLRDTIEHIPNQIYFMNFIKDFLLPDGKLFLAFPIWRMPFGGHQQICKNKILSHLPYFHILPTPLYKNILKIFNESDDTISELLSVKKSKISMSYFKKLLISSNLKIEKITYFLINPNYEIKFNLKPKELPFFLNIPYLRDFFITNVYCVLSQK